MAVVNKFNVNKQEVRLDADIIENMSANDVSYDASTQYDENTVGDKLSELSQQVIYDVSAHNDGVTFDSLSTLLSSENLSILIPSIARCGGMSIRFVQSSDNTYVQYRLMKNTWSTTETDWQGVDDKPTVWSNNLVKSSGVYADIHKISTETEQSTNLSGFWRYDTKEWKSDNFRNCLIIPYNSNNNYKIDTYIRATTIAGIIQTSTQPTAGVSLTDVLGYECLGTGISQHISEYTPNIPINTAYIIVQSTDNNKIATVTVEYTSNNYKFYTTEETDQKIQDIESKIPKVLDNLNSTSKSDALSAAQGKLLGDNLFENKMNTESVSVIIKTDNSINGRWTNKGTWIADNTRRSTEKIDVVEGEKYLITTNISSSTIIGYLVQWNRDTFIGNASTFNGGSKNAVDSEYIVPQGVTKIALTSTNTTPPSLKKVITVKEPLYYTKTAVNNLIADKYGVRWS